MVPTVIANAPEVAEPTEWGRAVRGAPPFLAHW
jgi:hypothetical protein